MESLLWTLTFGAIGLWLLTGWELVRSPLQIPNSWSTRRRRWLWLGCWALAGLGGLWGPELWTRSSADIPRSAGGGSPAMATTTELRTPFVVQLREVERDEASQILRAETRMAGQLPLLLLAFLGMVAFLRRNSATAHGERMDEESLPGVGQGSVNHQGYNTNGPSAAVLLLLGLGMPFTSGCAADEAADRRDRAHPTRTQAAVSWDTLVHRPIPVTDTLLFSADAVTTGEAGFWVLDRAAHRVAHFDWEGSLRWYAGRRGSGPGEFLNARTLQTDPDGAVHILDATNARISSFDAAGRLTRELPLGELDGTLHTFALAPDGIFGMITDGGLVPVRVDWEGRVERGTPIPVPGVAPTAATLALQGHALALRDEGGGIDGRWVYAFTVGDGFFRMDGLSSLGDPAAYPEPIPFPGVAETQSREGDQTVTIRQMEPPTFAAEEVSARGDRMAIRFFGETPERGRWLDLYEAESGEYLESLLLPAAGPAAWEPDRVVLLPADPEITLLVLQPRRD